MLIIKWLFFLWILLQRPFLLHKKRAMRKRLRHSMKYNNPEFTENVKFVLGDILRFNSINVFLYENEMYYFRDRVTRVFTKVKTYMVRTSANTKFRIWNKSSTRLRISAPQLQGILKYIYNNGGNKDEHENPNYSKQDNP